MVLCTTANYSWFVYHRSANAGGATTSLMLNSTSAAADEGNAGIQNLTSTTFDLGGSGAYSTRLNDSGQTYIAYIFAHNAGGFGLTGTDNVISCGSFTTDASGNATVSLGYEPQWMITKASTQAEGWYINDTMRGYYAPSQGATSGLSANTANAEAGTRAQYINSTGFTVVGGLSASQTYIYIAIRRGPMKVPTSGTSVFSPVARAGTSTATSVTTGFPVDFIISKGRNPSVGLGENWGEFDRLRGLAVLSSNNTGVEFTSPTYQLGIANFANNTGMNLSASDNDYGYINKSGYNYGTYFFQRAPSFFDEVCYTGDGGSNRALSHNLAAVPELAIFKRRSGVGDWLVWTTSQSGKGALLDTTDLFFTNANVAGSSTWTASTIYIKNPGFDGTATNGSGSTYVAYLFASCPGVSKVGSYTGNGTTQTINCGFTGGARFVLIKRTDSTGDWYVYDTARGMTTLTDPYLLMNSTAAESATLGSVTTVSTGFAVNASILAAINTNAASYIFLAIA
jgi:hypothetical protein